MSKADNKIRIIDLLNKIANGEEVKEFIYKGYIYQRHDCGYYRSVINSNWIGFHTDFDICSKEILNDYALLEDNTEEIEELSTYRTFAEYDELAKKCINMNAEQFFYKINELVKRINYIERKINDN